MAWRGEEKEDEEQEEKWRARGSGLCRCVLGLKCTVMGVTGCFRLSGMYCSHFAAGEGGLKGVSCIWIAPGCLVIHNFSIR